MLWIFVQQLNNDLAHVVTYYKVLEKVRNLINIRVRRCFVQLVVSYELRNFLSGSSSY